MKSPNASATQGTIESVYRAEARRVLATLIRLLGGFDVAEDALHDAFAVAAEQWPRDGVPTNPYAWLVSTGRFRTIDRRRRQTRVAGVLPEMAMLAEAEGDGAYEGSSGVAPYSVQDDELRLIFTCCHPALSPDARIALTLREVAGLTTEEIARAYLVSAPTIAQRIVRAKAKIRDEAIPYEIPERNELPARLESVLQVVYLIFNEGYAATEGPTLTRDSLCEDAIRLGRCIVERIDDPEALGLLALMMIHHARRATRVDDAGDLVLLEDQDRSRWDHGMIQEAQAIIDRALVARRVGPFLLQAAIAALHAEATSVQSTDWAEIVSLYDVLRRVDPSPVVALNRAVAISRRDGSSAGLEAVNVAMNDGVLDGYHLAHAARAELLQQLGQTELARQAYERALGLARQPAERRFLASRLSRLDEPAPASGVMGKPVGNGGELGRSGRQRT